MLSMKKHQSLTLVKYFIVITYRMLLVLLIYIIVILIKASIDFDSCYFVNLFKCSITNAMLGS